MEITDPTLVFLLITVGLVGIGVETLTPGGIFPAVVGVVALILGVIGYIDVDAPSGGAGLLLVSIAFFISAVALKRYRTLSAAGTVFLILSGVFMFDRDTDPTSIPAVLVGGLVLGGFMMFVIERAAQVKASPVRYGPEDLVGMCGDVRSSLKPRGQVFVDGTLWQAELAEGAEPVRMGEQVTVESVRGLTLLVRGIGGAAAAMAEPSESELQKKSREGVDR